MEVKHCVMDLEDFVAGMGRRVDSNIDAFVSKGPPTEVEEERFKVGYGLLKDLMKDLREVVDAWKEGYPARRVTEEAMEKAGEIAVIEER